MNRQNTPKTAKLTNKQTRAVAALLANSTRAQAAEASGLSERTLQRYMALPHFRQALTEAEAEAMAEAARRLAVDAGEATRTLKEIMGDKTAPAAARVRAALGWLSLTPGFREHVVLEARLEDLEAELLKREDK